MPRIKKIPTKPDFNFATRRAYEFLLELNITEFPVDPFEIFKEFDANWNLLSWSELKHSTNKEDPFYLRRDKAEAKTNIQRGTNDYIIVYDDVLFDLERIRWTLAHEIGHIVLGHLVYFEETALSRGGLNKEQYGVLEVEAHWFAGMLLSPHAILNLYNIKDSTFISFLCNLSKTSANKCEIYLRTFRSSYPLLEMKLIRNVYNFFYANGHLESITEGIYKFNGSYLYDDFFKLCRICRNCNAYIDNKEQLHCHICGDKLPDWDFPFAEQPVNGMWRGWPKNLTGKFYPYIETDKNNRVIFCPVCKNHSFSDDAKFCLICGNSLFNFCLEENLQLNGECRHCPSCGGVTKFQEDKLFDMIGEILIPDLLSFQNGKYEDFIEYEYWNFIKAVVRDISNKPGLFTSLFFSRAFIDDDQLLVFINNTIDKNIISENTEDLIDILNEYGFTKINKIEVISYDL